MAIRKKETQRERDGAGGGRKEGRKEGREEGRGKKKRKRKKRKEKEILVKEWPGDNICTCVLLNSEASSPNKGRRPGCVAAGCGDQACLGEVVGLVSDHGNKVDITIKRVT